MTDLLFRDLTDEEERNYRRWARDRFVAGEPADPLWHPIVRDEWRKLQARADRTGRRYVHVYRTLTTGDLVVAIVRYRAGAEPYTGYYLDPTKASRRRVQRLLEQAPGAWLTINLASTAPQLVLDWPPGREAK